MAFVQQLAFSDSTLDRDAPTRADENALASAIADPRSRVLPLWKGKPLVTGGDATELCWIALDQAGLEVATEPVIYLGRDDGAARFAVDISGWEPDVPPDGPIDAFVDASEQVHPDMPDGARFAELRGCMTALSVREAELAATARALIMWHTRHRFCANCGAASNMTQAGWQRDCPACKAQHYPRTDPVVIMLITRGNSVLMGRSPVWPAGMYSLLAGFIEPGETVAAAVRREVFEESGIGVGQVEFVVSQPWPFPASLMIACKGEALDTTITVDPVELEDAQWVTREDMVDVILGTTPDMTAARPGSIARFVIEKWLADDLDGLAP